MKNEGRWYKPQQILTQKPHGSIWDWLLGKGSLTARLKTHCREQFRVQVLFQEWQQPLASERDILQLTPKGTHVVREVILHCDDKPWVYARSVIPRSTLTGKEQALHLLGTKPLGQVLFDDPLTKRGTFEITRLLPEHALFPRAQAAAGREIEMAWGRRSVFYLSNKPLLVAEYFLPALLEATCKQTMEKVL